MTKLIWLTDIHLVEPDRDWPQNADPLQRLRACLAEIRSLHHDADRIVISGDLVHLRNPGAYRVLRLELESMAVPYHLLVGNHDDRAALVEAFPEIETIAGFIQGADDLAHARLLYLDTQSSDGKHHGELCAERMGWIADQIKAADDRPLLVFQHHPPCEIGVPALDRLRLLDSRGLADMVRARRAPTHLFCGHLHRNVSGL